MGRRSSKVLVTYKTKDMKGKTITKSNLIKQYHTLAGKLRLSDEDRLSLLSGYGVSSSKDLSIDQIQELCALLKRQLNSDADKWRKRVLASVYGYLQLTGRAANMEYVKAVACRSAGCQRFNEVPVQKLITLYYAFLDKQKVLKRTGELVSEDLEIMQFKN